MKKNNLKIEELHEKLHNVSLRSEEKLNMLHNIQSYMDAKPVPSDLYANPFFRQMFAYSIIGAMVLTTGATSLSFAAESALPGDMLYGIKTNVNETIFRTVAFTPTTKAQTEIDLIDRRMEELGKMTANETKTPEKVEMVIKKINKHQDSFDVHIAKVEQTKPNEKAIKIRKELIAVIETHLEVLEKVTEEKDPEITKEIPTPEPTSPDTAPEPEKTDKPTIKIDIPTSEGNGTDNTLKAAVSVVHEGAEDSKSQEVEVEIDIADISKSKIQIALQQLRDRSLINTANPSEEEQKVRREIRKRIIEKAEKELGVDIEI